MTLDEFRSLLDEALAFYNSEHSGAQIDEGVAGGLGAIRYDVVQVLAEAQKERARKNLGIDELPNGGGSGPGTFIAVYGQTTSAEIEAAYLAGQTVAVLYENRLGYLIQRTSATDHTFATTAPFDSEVSGIPIYVLSCYADAWGFSVLDAENVQNKVDTITDTANNTQYPSARAVIDYVDNYRKTFEAIFDVTTSEEIEAAYQEGKTITMNNNGVIYYLRERANSQLFIFTTAPFYLDIFQEINIYTATCNNSSWSLATTKAEAVSNKVTTIDANSTNKQYPSAKAVFDYVGAMAGGGGGGSGADLLNENGIIKQQYFPEGYPYSEIGEGIVLPETSVDINPDSGEGILVATFELVEGQSYTVGYNGADYECVCGTVEGTNALALGNIGGFSGGEDSGEPFVLLKVPDELVPALGETAVLYAVDGITPATLSIKSITEVPTPIAQKFLPVGYPYFVPGGEVIFPETTVTHNAAIAPSLDIKQGYSYTVAFNGESYECTAMTTTMEDVSTLMLGNLGILGSIVDTGEPFCLLLAPGVGWIIYIADGMSSATLSITQADSYLKMDDKYIPSTSKSLLVTLIGYCNTAQGEVTVEKISHTFAEIKSAFHSGSMVFLEYKYGDAAVITGMYVLSNVTKRSLLFTRTVGPNVGQALFEQIEINASSDIDVASGKIYYTSQELSTNISTQLVLTSPNGKKFKVTVDNSGTLSATEVTA